MSIIDLFTIIGEIMIALGGILIGAGVMALFAWLRQRQKSQQMINELVQALDHETLIALRVETNNDQFLCYNARTQDFVCQGRSLIEIKDRFKQRFPDKDAAICDGDETAIRVLKQQIKELYENSHSVRSSS